MMRDEMHARAQWAVHGTDAAPEEPTAEAMELIHDGVLPWGATQGAAGKVHAARYRQLTAELARTEEEQGILDVEVQRALRHFQLRQEGVSRALARIADRQAVLNGAFEAGGSAAATQHPGAGRGSELEEEALLEGKAALLRLSARRWRLIEAAARKKWGLEEG
jgi:hypothetical protein